MDFEVHWPVSARRALKRIVDYLMRTDEEAVPVVVGPILQKIDSLAGSPYTGDVWQRAGSREIRVTLAGSYRIFFEVDPEEHSVTIRNLLHVRQQDPEFPE